SHVPLLGTGDVALVTLSRAGDSTADADPHHKNACQDGHGEGAELEGALRSTSRWGTWWSPVSTTLRGVV